MVRPKAAPTTRSCSTSRSRTQQDYGKRYGGRYGSLLQRRRYGHSNTPPWRLWLFQSCFQGYGLRDYGDVTVTVTSP
eukprot:4246828-Prymnesium_polylepis.1